MRCIFCKCHSESSVSVEHILPESLGNIDHTLPPGWVCDPCNNYFAHSVEKPFLDSTYGTNLRFEMRVPNKRGRVPPASAWHLQSRTKVDVMWSPLDGISIGAAPGEDESRWITSIQGSRHGSLYIVKPEFPDVGHQTSRFICKIALEVLAHRCLEIPGWNDEIVEKVELDAIRNYARKGALGSAWPIHIRHIYAPDHAFTDREGSNFEVLHEFTILATRAEYYAIIAIFGVEYSVNLGGPELDGYHRWLRKNHSRSPLYMDEKI